MADLAGELRHRGLLAGDADSLELSRAGRAAGNLLVEAGRAELLELLENWKCHDDQELGPVLRRLAPSLVAEVPEDTRAEPVTR